MSAPVIRHEQRQHQTLTPRLQQAVRLLQLSSLDFALEVNQAMGNNPFLEPDEAEAETVAATADTSADQAPIADAPATAASAEGAAEAPTENAWEGDGWSQYGKTRTQSGRRARFRFSDITPAVCRCAIICLRSQNGWLIGARSGADGDDHPRNGRRRLCAHRLEELKALSGSSVRMTRNGYRAQTRAVADPVGVSARDLRECLLLQLREDDDPEKAAVCRLAQRIVIEQLDRLAMRDVSGLARALGVSENAISQAADCIRRLQPRPGWRFGAANTRFVTPDVVVRKIRGNWTVTLNPSVVPKVRLNRMYADLFQSHRDARHSDLAAQLQEARWTVRNVEQRFATILRVAQVIVQRQRHFLDYGELAMKPLGLREIADELGLHESTVSRVTNNKYMATPLGVFELKYFFSRALATTSGGKCSATAIRGAIKDMIHEENPQEPLSDASIARLLARQGLQVARRTVTKYRQMMRVPAYEMRRRGA